MLFDGFFQLVQGSLDRLYALGDPPVYEPTPDRTVAAMAEAAGVAPIEMLYTVMLEHGAQHLLMLPFFNYAERNHDAIREMLLHPGGVSGLSDGGAHCGLICDASIPTFMLTHWARDRTRGDTLPLEYLVKKQTSDTAALYGLGDRGVLAPGNKADVNVWNRKNKWNWTPLLIAEGHRPGNFRPAPDTIAAIEKVMKAAGVAIPPKAKADNKPDYGTR